MPRFSNKIRNAFGGASEIDEIKYVGSGQGGGEDEEYQGQVKKG